MATIYQPYLTPAVMSETVKPIRFAHKTGLIGLLRTVSAAIANQRAGNVAEAAITASAAYDATELQAVADKLDELINALVDGGVMTAPTIQ